MNSDKEEMAAAIRNGGFPADHQHPKKPVAIDASSDGFTFTDSGNAERLIRHHGANLRYVPAWDKWLVFDGQRYVIDHQNVKVNDLAGDVGRRLASEGVNIVDSDARKKQMKHASKSLSAVSITAMVKLARSVPGISVRHTDLDRDHNLLNVENGVIDLRTRELLEHSAERLITKLAPVRYDPDAVAATWLKFLDTVQPDPEMQLYLRRGVGYSLSGDVTEQVLFIKTGVGANGKTTFAKPVITMMGDYAVNAPKDLLIASKHEQHPTSFTDLHGARFALAMETEEGAKLAEAQIKQLTGGDQITARRMRENNWTFDPTHKLWLGCNHLPKINGRDHAIWRRIRVIPFDVVIPAEKQDRRLPEKLIAELSGILNWALAGHADWVVHGLETPAAVTEATKTYRADSDWLTNFLEANEYVVTPGRGSVFTAELREKLEKWCREEGVQLIGRKPFAAALEAAGCESWKDQGKRAWKGLMREG